MDERKIMAYVLAAAKFGGVGSLCALISYLEPWERYEECADIVAAIRRIMGDEWELDGGFRWGEPLKEWIYMEMLTISIIQAKNINFYIYAEYAEMVFDDVNNRPNARQ